MAIAFASAAAITAYIAVLGYRQKLWIMNVVYPVTRPVMGPVAACFYFTRASASRSA